MLLRVSEVARTLHISPSSVYELIQRGTLPCHRVGPRGGAIRVSSEDLDKFVQQCRHAVEHRERQAVQRVRLKHLRA
jgi:excisionase family DNA binding protein